MSLTYQSVIYFSITFYEITAGVKLFFHARSGLSEYKSIRLTPFTVAMKVLSMEVATSIGVFFCYIHIYVAFIKFGISFDCLQCC